MVNLEERTEKIHEEESLVDYFLVVPKERGPIAKVVYGAIDGIREQYRKLTDYLDNITGWK